MFAKLAIRKVSGRADRFFVFLFFFQTIFSELYEKARSGKLQGFTGIDSIYEAPTAPDLVLKAGEESEADCVQQVLQFLYEKGILPEEAFGRLFENNDDEASDEHFAYIKVDKAVLSAAQTPEERRKWVFFSAIKFIKRVAA